MAEYKPQVIEAKWQKRWDGQRAFEADPDPKRPKYYVLEMLPYPSGTLHMGHMRNYTIGDAVARYKRMRGFNVLHPMGWDAFGLPAENAAIQHRTHPRDWTKGNIAEFKHVCQRFGFSYDWRREISTCEPEFYRWNQWFFLRMLERGLAYRKLSRVNWCPKCQTVLANEQVVEGCCWRHEDTPVEAKEIEQWFLKTTQYADALLDDIAELAGGWPARVLVMQRNWIGKSRGAMVRFTVTAGSGATGGAIEVFTTRIDTIYGASAVILAPEHPSLGKLVAGVKGLAAIQAQLARLRQRILRPAEMGTVEKEGIFIGRFAVNPFSGESLPIWVANFVLMEYGAGAVMCVPAHDQRDFEFAEKYQLPKPIVVQPAAGKPLTPMTLEKAFTDYGRLVDSGPYTDLGSEQAIEKMTTDAQSKAIGEARTTYRLKDWGISRQRYWGTPIPVLYCERCGMVPVPDDQLPVVLPPNVQLTGMGQSPLAGVPEFVNATCTKCGGPARRETDTMDTFVDSSWYFYRYTDARNDQAPFDPEKAGYWFGDHGIDQYIGGIEHAILHLIYSRFWTKFMRDMGLIKNDEPVERLFTQGMIIKGGAKMSKSLGNVVSPDEMVERFGADAARMYSLFATSPDRELDWQDEGVAGIYRFLGKVYRFVARNAPNISVETQLAASSVRQDETLPATSLRSDARAIQRKLHQTIKSVTDDFQGRWHFNTSIAAIMELMNELHAAEDKALPARLFADVQRNLILLLAPFAPYLAHELWETLGEKSNLLKAAWPKFDPELAKEEEIEIPVQVNGKLRSKIVVRPETTKEERKQKAVVDQKIQNFIAGKQIVKVIFTGKLVN